MIKVVTPAGGGLPWLVVGCDDGTVTVFDGKGNVIRSARVNGAPTCVDTFTTPGGPVVVMATAKGEVKGFGN